MQRGVMPVLEEKGSGICSYCVVANTTGYNGTSHILHGYVGCPEPMNENALEGGTPCDRVLAETDGTGPAGTKREYIWLGDMPVAVIDKSVTPNKTYMVHADHLNRRYFMTDSTKAQVWKAIYEPFGTVYSTTGTAAQTYRFPGQWFQIESGLAYNWHRHYDATLGRYVSADPLNTALHGAPITATTIKQDTRSIAETRLSGVLAGQLPALGKPGAALPQNTSRLAISGLFKDGPSIYGYVGQHPFGWTDFSGLAGDGTPGNNQAQNAQVSAVCSALGLTKDQRRLLHQEISGQNMCYAEILATAKSMFCK